MAATDFQGWEIKFTATNAQLPTGLLAADGYKATPLQRTELKATRDGNIDLHRTTSPFYKTKIEVTFVDMQLAEYAFVRSLLNNAVENAQQRKVQLTYWDDELLEYRTAYFYWPDITYTHQRISANNILYKGFTMKFIEY